MSSSFDVPRGTPVSRKEDMSPDGKLVLIQQADGDIIVNVRTDESDSDYQGSPFGVSVEFCATGCGGGRSPHTLKSLKELMRAMVRDNEENKLD